ncbi:MAG: hypothetical protein ABIY52_00465 [Gemmatimonadaceae bacterium]
MMDDEFEDLLRDASRTYHTPPAPPREAMWDAIARARDAAAVVPIAAPRRTARWAATAASIAAILMVGVMIGRTTRGPVAVPATVASAEHVTPAPIDTIPGAMTRVEGGAEPVLPTPDVRRNREEPRRVAASGRGAIRAPRATSEREPGMDMSGDANAYRLAVVEHLTRTELLLTSFRAKEKSGEAVQADAQFAALSRELLGTTRVLLATRRGDDPMMTRLLQDLEYVIMQISQYSNDGRRADLDAINQSLDKRNVLPKLRSTIPAGVAATSGT